MEIVAADRDFIVALAFILFIIKNYKSLKK